MAVVHVSLISAGRSGSGKSDHTHSYKTVHQVIVDDPYDGVGTVGNAFGIPPRYAAYVGFERSFSDPFALCTNVDPQCDGIEWQKWLVTSTFDSNYQSKKEDDPEDDPVLTWIEIETERRKVVKTWDSKDIVNSAGQLIDGIERDYSVISYNFLRNELAITSKLLTHNNATNSDTFYGMTKGTALLKITIDKPQRRNEYVFWPHTYKVKYDPLGWNRDIADQGTAVKRPDGTLDRPLNPNTNQPIDGEVNLDGTGKLLGAGLPIVYLSSFFAGGIPQIYKPQAFAALSL